VKANEDNPEPILSEDEVKKLSIKVLRSKLRIRGLECKGCAEKQDYVKMFMENQHLPVIDHQKNPKNEPQKKKMKDKEMEDVSHYHSYMTLIVLITTLQFVIS
jgi:hypothetical protein